TAPVFDVTLLDSTRSLGLPVAFSQSAPLKSAFQVPQVRLVQSVPPTAPRPAASLQALAQRGKTVAKTLDDPFDRLFGKPRENGSALAYAASDGGVFNDGQSKSPGRVPPNDGQTAIYDIS